MEGGDVASKPDDHSVCACVGFYTTGWGKVSPSSLDTARSASGVPATLVPPSRPRALFPPLGKVSECPAP
eukprot:4816014-Pyramimonas_sp.AAC.1